jgi:hypothetical protein
MLAMRPIGLRLRHGVDALGNAIGESLASQTSDYSRWGTDDTETQRLLARYPAPAPDLPSVDFETRPPLPDINERPLPEIGDVPGLRPEDRLVRLPRVVVTGSRANASSGLTSETAAEIGGISGREDGLALAGRYLDYSRQLRGHAANAGSSAIAKTYNSMADDYAAKSREASRVSGQFTTYSSVPRQTVNPPSFDVGAGWSYMGANSDGTSSMTRWDSRTLEQIDRDLNRFTGLVVTAPVTVPLLFTGWGFAGAATLGGGTAGYQYFTSGNVNAYDVMEMGSLWAALPSLATSAYSLTTRAWSALSLSEAASTSRFVGNVATQTEAATASTSRVVPPRLQGLTPGQPLPDGLEIVVLGNTNKPGNFILRPGIDDKPIGGLSMPGKSVSIGTDLEIASEYQKMFGSGRAMVRGDTLSGAFTEDIRAAGFDVLYAPTEKNIFHARIVGVDRTFDELGRDYLSLAFDRIARQKSGAP